MRSFELLTLDLFEIFHVECLTTRPFNFYDKLMLSTLIPLGLGVVLIGTQLAMVGVYGGSLVEGMPIKLFLMIIFFTLPTISNVIFSSFR